MPDEIRPQPGEIWRTREGQRVGPLKAHNYGTTDPNPMFTLKSCGSTWRSDGKYLRGGNENPNDLVALWEEPPASVNRVFEGKVHELGGSPPYLIGGSEKSSVSCTEWISGLHGKRVRVTIEELPEPPQPLVHWIVFGEAACRQGFNPMAASKADVTCSECRAAIERVWPTKPLDILICQVCGVTPAKGRYCIGCQIMTESRNVNTI